MKCTAMIRVMSFNIRMGLAEDGVNHWQHRKELTLARIRAFAPDLLGLQECCDNADQAGFLRAGLPDYEFFGIQRGGNKGAALEMAPVLFKKSSFELVDQGCFWLSESQDVAGSVSWDADFPRTCLWFRLRHRTTNRELVFLNTHFDYQPVALAKSAKLLKNWLVSLNLPVVVTGDFNDTKDSQAYQTLLCSGLNDANPGSENTFHDFGKLDSGNPIDWILVSPDFSVLETQIDTYHEGDLYPSDHYPLTATLSWKT